MDAPSDQLELFISIVGGSAGSLAYASLHDGTTIRQKAVDFFVGSSAAIFIGPWVAVSFSIQSLAGYRAVIFVSGLFGCIVLKAATSYAELHAADLFVSFLRRMTGRQTSPEPQSRTQVKQDDKQGG